jgi:hypothetical protein
LLPEEASIRLDRGYDSEATRQRLKVRDLLAEISENGKPAPLNATGRWIVERTNSWQNAHKKLVWCTERRARMVDFWMAFSNVVIIVGRLVREAGSAIDGTADPYANHDLSAQDLGKRFARSQLHKDQGKELRGGR